MNRASFAVALALVSLCAACFERGSKEPTSQTKADADRPTSENTPRQPLTLLSSSEDALAHMGKPATVTANSRGLQVWKYPESCALVVGSGHLLGFTFDCKLAKPSLLPMVEISAESALGKRTTLLEPIQPEEPGEDPRPHTHDVGTDVGVDCLGGRLVNIHVDQGGGSGGEYHNLYSVGPKEARRIGEMFDWGLVGAFPLGDCPPIVIDTTGGYFDSYNQNRGLRVVFFDRTRASY